LLVVRGNGGPYTGAFPPSLQPVEIPAAGALPKPEPNAEYQCGALLLAMRAGEAGGGRRGQWGP